MPRKISAIAFDIDGTLVQSEHLQYESWREALKPFGVRLGRGEYLSYCGQPGSVGATALRKSHLIRISPAVLLARKEALMHRWISKKKPRLMPGARKMLMFLAEFHLPMAAVTGAPNKELLLKLERTGIADLFNAFVGSNDVKNSKPHPEPYLMACKRIGAKPRQTLAFEDTSYGVESAKRAGLVVIAVPSAYARGQDFSRADFVCKDLHAALRIARRMIAKK